MKGGGGGGIRQVCMALLRSVILGAVLCLCRPSPLAVGMGASVDIHPGFRSVRYCFFRLYEELFCQRTNEGN